MTISRETLTLTVDPAAMLKAVQREIVDLDENFGLRVPAIYGAVMFLLQRAIDEDKPRF